MAEIIVQTAFRFRGVPYPPGGGPIEVDEETATWAMAHGYASKAAGEIDGKAIESAPRRVVKPKPAAK